MKRSGNTVLITGGASGIGLALARALVSGGNDVVVCGRDQAKLDAAASAVAGLSTIRTDVASAAGREALIARLRERHPSLNVLINNAGIVNVADVRAEDFLAVFEREIATNLTAPVALATTLLPILERSQNATIVNVTSGYVFVPSARTAAYSATKTALHVMTQAMRYQLRDSSVRVVEVMPPPVATAMADHYRGSKLTPERAAAAILRGLQGDRVEIVIGISRAPQILARIAPRLAFGLINDMESKWSS